MKNNFFNIFIEKGVLISESILRSKKLFFLVSLVLIVIVFYPVLLGGKVTFGDSTELVIPQLAFYERAFTSGESPFWNPYIAVGFPNFISVGGHPFSPFNLLLFLMSPIAAHYWIMFILAVATLFFTVLFLRELGISPGGAVIGGLAYLMGSLFYFGSAVNTVAIFIQAILFWSIIRISKETSKRFLALYVILGSFAVMSGWLMSAYWPNLYIFTTALFFVVFLTAKIKRAGEEGVARLWFGLASIFLLGTAVGLLQLVPAYLISMFSGRGGGIDYNMAQGSALTFKSLLNFFYLTPYRGLEAYLYIGIVPLIFFVLSFTIKGNGFLKFFRWLFLVVFFTAIKYSPIFWLINKLPLFNYFQGSSRFMLIGSFAASVLVGFGIDHFVSIKQINQNTLKKILFSLFLGVFLVFIEIVGTYWIGVIVSFSLIILSYSVLFFIRNRKIVLIFLVLITILDFIQTIHRFNKPLLIDRADYENPTSTLNYLKTQNARILPLFVDDWDDTYFYQLFNESRPDWANGAKYDLNIKRATYFPNIQVFDGLKNIEVNEPLINVNMGRFLALLGTRQLITTGGEAKLDKLYKIDENTKKDVSINTKHRKIYERQSLINFLGISHILTVFDMSADIGSDLRNDWQYLADAGFDISMGRKLQKMPMHIYANPYVKPTAYFSLVSEYVENSDVSYNKFKSGGFEGLFVECAVSCPDKPNSDGGDVKIISEGNGLLELETSSKEKSFLVFTQNYLPGWKAYIDSADTKIYRINGVFIGIPIPAGEHKIIFKYDYWSLFDPKLILEKIYEYKV